MKTRECLYDLHYYGHQQFWSLVRDLTSCGWTVTIQANEERRPPDKLPEAYNAYQVSVSNSGWDVPTPVTRDGKTPWEALCRAVEVVNVAESGEERIAP
jgi:hypothetical protein